MVLTGMIFAFRVEEAFIFLKERLVEERTQQLLRGVEFSYGGNLVSVERFGLDGFIESLIRKSAPFGYFF